MMRELGFEAPYAETAGSSYPKDEFGNAVWAPEHGWPRSPTGRLEDTPRRYGGRLEDFQAQSREPQRFVVPSEATLIACMNPLLWAHLHMDVVEALAIEVCECGVYKDRCDKDDGCKACEIVENYPPDHPWEKNDGA